MRDKVVKLDELKREFQASPSVEIAEIHAGFSRRLNFFIDISDIDTPSINDGRVTFVAEMLNVSRPAVTDWLTKNKPPKETTLFEVVSYFLKHIDGGEDIFAHYSTIQMDGYRTLKAGQDVDYELNAGPKGHHAASITPKDIDSIE